MASGISSSELVELAAYETLDPPVGYRIDAGFALLLCFLYNLFRGKGPAKKPDEFMPEYGPQQPTDPLVLAEKLRARFGIDGTDT
jgi:hypothetical protein